MPLSGHGRDAGQVSQMKKGRWQMAHAQAEKSRHPRHIRYQANAATGIAYVELARPEKRNALHGEMIAGLTSIFEHLKSRREIASVVLSGGDFFCAGADTSILADGVGSTDLIRASALAGERMCEALASLPQISIAAIEKGAIGGGLSLASFCDWRVMATSSWVWAPEVSLGLFLGWNTLPRLSALVGASRAKQISLLGERHNAEICQRWGFADRLAEPGEAMRTAKVLAAEIARHPKLPVTLMKRRIDHSMSDGQTGNKRSDVSDVAASYCDPDGCEAREAAFAPIPARLRIHSARASIIRETARDSFHSDQGK